MSTEIELGVILNFVSSLIWPVVLLVIVFSFKRQIESLFDRIKTSEIAGAKFSFSEAASGLISSKVDSIAEEENAQRRAMLADEVKTLAEAIGAIHPVALSILIGGANGSSWSSGAYEGEKKYFQQLEKANLAVIKKKTDEHLKLISLELQPKGKELLDSIGFYH